jgi:hypothetical protein
MRYFFRICQQSEFFHAQKGHVFYLLLFSVADAMSAFLIYFDYVFHDYSRSRRYY